MREYNYDTVIFDLDGTLLNTLDDLYYSTNYTLKEFNYPQRSKEEVRCFVGNGVEILMKKAVPGNINNFDIVLDVFKEYYKKHSMDHISVYEGIYELLEYLKNKHIKIAVVTNKFELAAKNIVDKFFKEYVTCTIGENTRLKKKPHPDMILKALEMLDSKPSQTIYIGDSEVDIMTAQNTSLFCLSATWGFRTKLELEKSGAKTIINTPQDIYKYFK